MLCSARREPEKSVNYPRAVMGLLAPSLLQSVVNHAAPKEGNSSWVVAEGRFPTSGLANCSTVGDNNPGPHWISAVFR